MRIALGTNNLGLGGAQAALVAVAAELAKRSHEVTLWVLQDQPREMQRIDDIDPKVVVRRFALGSFKSRGARRELQRAIRADSPEAALYVGNPIAASIHALASPATPVFYWVQNYIRSGRGRRLELAARLSGVRIVALNQSVASTVIGGSRTVVPNPMAPPHREQTDDVPPPAWLDGRLLTVGRIVPQKDHDFLLDVMSALRARHKSFELDIVGGPESQYFDEVKAAVRQQGLAHVMHFHGRASAVPWFERRPMFVLTSQWEGQGVVLLEAASYGCPVIARDAPGVRDTLGVCYEGLTQHDNPTAMAALIEERIGNPDATATQAKRLQERMYEQYSCARVVNTWERLFERSRGWRLPRLPSGHDSDPA